MTQFLVDGRRAPSFKVSVVLERRDIVLSSGFPHVRWSLHDVLVRPASDVQPGDSGRVVTSIAEDEDFCHLLWTGLELHFYRDGGESYWHTLVGEQQQLYVVCQDDEDDELAPILVTADYDEAMAYQEADDTVLSCDLPEEIYRVLERFVLENYTPQQKKRRKRKQWHNSQEQGDEPFARRPK